VPSNGQWKEATTLLALDRIKHDTSRALQNVDALFRLPLRSMQMMDLIMLALGLAFFALSVGYTIACDRL
jgi:SNF family Na+-dependent transporter